MSETRSNGAIEQTPRGNKRVKWWVGISLVLVLACVAGYFLIKFSSLFSRLGDCGWSGRAFAWIDENGDGIFQENEPPLPGIQFHVDDTVNQYTDVGSGVTNWSGISDMEVFMAGCPKVEFEIKADLPPGYKFTTAASLSAKADESDQTFEFGFKYLPGMPTMTPRPEKPHCMIVPEFKGQAVNAITSDGEKLWVASFGTIAQLNLSTDSWTHYNDISDYPINITIGPDRSIWLITILNNPNYTNRKGSGSNEPIFLSRIYRLNGPAWEEYSPKELDGKSVKSIAFSPDGNLWFSTWGDGVLILDPETNTWSSDESESFVEEVLFSSDGKPFLISDSGGGAVSLNGSVWGKALKGRISNWIEFYDPQTKQITNSAVENIDLCLSDIKLDSQDGMWLAKCSEGLLYIPDPINGEVSSWQEYHSEIGFPSDETLDIYLQQDNLIWVATKKGLARCKINTQ